MIALALFIGLANAIDTRDHLELHLHGGEAVDGWFLRAEDDLIIVQHPLSGGTARVPLSIVDTVVRNGAPWEMSAFRTEVAEARDALAALRADPGPHPPGITTAALSIMWAGAGHGALGEWRRAGGYLIIDGAAMGFLVHQLRGPQEPIAVFGAIAVSGLFKVHAAQEAWNLSRKRRVRLGISRRERKIDTQSPPING